MLYIRKLFTQDLRDGKQIAFPKEPSYSFFSFDYQNKEADRRITFTFNARFEQFQEYDGKVITTRLYAAGSESRMDGEVKAFIRDELNAKVDDLLILKNKGTKYTEYEVMFVPQNNKYYSLLLKLCGGDNHSVYSADLKIKFDRDEPLQSIYYGAPGTGKSHEIKEKTKGEAVIRTTFHPDSDYSTFVGCYKPTMVEEEAKVIPVVVNNGISLDQNRGTFKDKRISYQFVMQAFLKAYLSAWKKYTDRDGDCVKPQFLIIEEINRGNCAQILGDLFQLLDRGGNGFSEYPIEADTDLQQEIERAFKEHKDNKLESAIDAEGKVEDYTSNYGATLSEDIQSGRVLLLPSNLYIWATMNTSDQSLFPIDSAFKRRWDWKYMKIKDEHKEWKVDIDIKSKDAEGNETSKKLDWWTFVDKINKIIASMTSSADKQLGYFFCKATKKTNDSDAEPTIITKDTFVSKVIFYLWNDVFKDYGFEDASLFRYKEVNPDTNKEEEKDLTFPDFYDEAGEEVNTKRLTDFVDKVLNWQQTKEEQK